MIADFDIPGTVRRVRRHADLSQRQLADLCGISVAKLERGSDLGVDLLARILALAGWRLAVVTDSGDAVGPMRPDGVRDRAGRRLPAHLDPEPAPLRPLPWRERDHRERAPDEATFVRERWRRDVRRTLLGAPPDHPAPADILATRRRTRRWQPAPRPRTPECGCGPECERTCVPACACQCEPPGAVAGLG